jgi:hypothetical protein
MEEQAAFYPAGTVRGIRLRLPADLRYCGSARTVPLACLAAFKTGDDLYAFPAKWFAEKQRYAVMGSHLSFG